MGRTDFRYDINGLRAIAVIIVLLYHFRVTAFSGGFVGVDVFFVISGYLMTSIIVGGLKSGTFTIPTFWWRRICRIVPALFVLLLTLLVLGWFFIDPVAYLAVAKEAMSSELFVSNIHFYRQDGYFDSDSETKWLLHTWSLSVEWQFYLLYPLGVAAIARLFGLKWLPMLIGLALASSLVLCILLTAYKASFAFFMFPTRAWEMLAGSLVFLYLSEPGKVFSPLVSRVGQIAGVAIIIAASTGFSPANSWPSYNALIPVLGAVLVIATGQSSSGLWHARPVQAIGRWSYSIYLWHWPIVVGLKYYEWFDVPIFWTGGILLSLLLGGLSYAYVERPAQTFLTSLSSHGWHGVAAVASSIALFVAAFAIQSSNGVTWRSQGRLASEYIKAVNDRAFSGAECSDPSLPRGMRICEADDSGAPSTLIIGDSHADAWYPRYGNHAWKSHVAFAVQHGCPSVPGVNVVQSGGQCDKGYEKALDLALHGNFNRVVFISNWAPYFDLSDLNAACIITGSGCRTARSQDEYRAVFSKFRSDLAKLRAAGREVIVVLSPPLPNAHLPQELSKRAFLGRDIEEAAWVHIEQHRNRSRFIRSALADTAAGGIAQIVDPADYMCGKNGYCPLLDADGTPLFMDEDHIRASVARKLDYLDIYILNTGKNDSDLAPKRSLEKSEAQVGRLP